MTTLRLTAEVTAQNPYEHDLYLDDSGQLEFIGSDISDTTDYGLAIAQTIVCRLLFVRGEWYQDQRLGTPWRERVWKKGVTETQIYRMIQEVLLSTPGVQSVVSMSVSIDATTRTATISDLKIIAETGQIVTIDQLDSPMIISTIKAEL